MTGRALYASDRPGPETMARAALVTSTIACGRITGFDLGAAERVPGVLGSSPTGTSPGRWHR